MIFYCIEVSGDREVQRTILEVLNQLDGFSSDDSIKVIAATNRADILDPALMRSGCLDCKIEFPHSTEEARAQILQIHSRKMNVHPNINFKELVRSTDDFNGAQLNAVCVEAGMFAPRRDATEVLITPMTNSPPSHKNDDKCNRKGLEARVQPNHLKDGVYSGVEAIKYLHSYIFKGHEMTQLYDETAIRSK